MGVSGCTSCQLGGAEALKAYDRAYQVKRNEEATQNTKRPEPDRASPLNENRPVAGATAGSSINISV